MKLVTASAFLLGQARSIWVSMDLSFGVDNFIEDVFGDSLGADITNHGCWCVQFNQEIDTNGYGGEAVDEVDRLCKQWRAARVCSRQYPGGACFISPYAGGYGYTTDFSLSNPDVSCAVRVGQTNCHSWHCTIDTHYALEINGPVGT